jgi:hypothetical protein
MAPAKARVLPPIRTTCATHPAKFRFHTTALGVHLLAVGTPLLYAPISSIIAIGYCAQHSEHDFVRKTLVLLNILGLLGYLFLFLNVNS